MIVYFQEYLEAYLEVVLGNRPEDILGNLHKGAHRSIFTAYLEVYNQAGWDFAIRCKY